MKLILSPAITLLNRLTYPQKFALISLLFVVPLAVVMVLLIIEIDSRIAFARKELYGTAYLRPLRVMHELVPRANLVAADQPGYVALRQPELVQLHAQIDQAFAELSGLDREYGAQLKTADQAAALATQWQMIKRNFKLLEPPARTAWYAQLTRNTRSLMAQVGNSSNLILDPDLDSYYLMDAVLIKLPEEQTLLGQTLWLGLQLPVDGRVTSDEKAEMTIYRGMLQAQAQQRQRNMEVALDNNASGQLAGALGEPLASATSATQSFIEIIDPHLSNAQLDYSDEFAPRGQRALAASFQLWDQTITELDRLLQARIDAVMQKKQIVTLIALSMLLLVLYLLIAFYQSVMRTVGQLELAAARLVRGDTAELVDLDTRDELGQVATSFNHVATALLTASAHREAIFAHAVDGIITLDEQQRVVSCNPAAERLFGYGSAEILGQPVAQLMPGFSVASAGASAVRREELGQREDGSEIPLELALSSMCVGAQRLTMVIARDISDRKQMEAERDQIQQTIIQAQAATLEALATPLIPVTDQIVVMPLIGALDQRRVQQVIMALLHGVEAHAAQVAILDITGVPAIDTRVAQGLLDAAHAVRLLGARVVLTGIRPEVAHALTALSIDLRAIVTRSTLQDGIAYALAQSRPGSAAARHALRIDSPAVVVQS